MGRLLKEGLMIQSGRRKSESFHYEGRATFLFFRLIRRNDMIGKKRFEMSYFFIFGLPYYYSELNAVGLYPRKPALIES